jgi:hypothetical protein
MGMFWLTVLVGWCLEGNMRKIGVFAGLTDDSARNNENCARNNHYSARHGNYVVRRGESAVRLAQGSVRRADGAVHWDEGEGRWTEVALQVEWSGGAFGSWRGASG